MESGFDRCGEVLTFNFVYDGELAGDWSHAACVSVAFGRSR
jgi:hypothetical protein